MISDYGYELLMGVLMREKNVALFSRASVVSTTWKGKGQDDKK